MSQGTVRELPEDLTNVGNSSTNGAATAALIMPSMPRTPNLPTGPYQTMLRVIEPDGTSRYYFPVYDNDSNATAQPLTNQTSITSPWNAARVEVTQKAMKFRGNVTDYHLSATQLVSPVTDPSLLDKESQGKGEDKKGEVIQDGMRFFQLVTDVRGDLQQSAGGVAGNRVNQDGVEYERDTTKGTFKTKQHAW